MAYGYRRGRRGSRRRRQRRRRYRGSRRRIFGRGRRRRANRPEEKYVIWSPYTVFGLISNGGTLNWTEHLMPHFQQGSFNGNRIGRRVNIKSLECRWWMRTGATQIQEDDFNNKLRIVIASWNPTTVGAGVQLNTDLHTHKTFDGPLFRTYALPHLRHKYYDRVHTLSVITATQTEGYIPREKQFHFYKRWRNFRVNFVDDTENYPDKILAISVTCETGIPPYPLIDGGYIKLTYTDV